MIDKKKNSLSMANFKNERNELVDPATLDDVDFIDYVLTVLMKETIEVLEMAVQNDRIFGRSKYEVMAAFHLAQQKLHARNGLSNG
jgi:hypothetical protein